jgi:hypothetical protein
VSYEVKGKWLIDQSVARYYMHPDTYREPVENKHVKRVSSLMPPPVYFSATGKYRPVNKIMLFIITGYACAKVSISASSSLSFARPGNPEANYFCAQACTNRIFFVILTFLLSNPKNFPPP